MSTRSSNLSAQRDKIKHISDIFQFETPYQPDVKVAVVLHWHISSTLTYWSFFFSDRTDVESTHSSNLSAHRDKMQAIIPPDALYGTVEKRPKFAYVDAADFNDSKVRPWIYISFFNHTFVKSFVLVFILTFTFLGKFVVSSLNLTSFILWVIGS